MTTATKSMNELLAASERIGAMVDQLRELKREFGSVPVNFTDELHMASVHVEMAQEVLTREIGLLARVEYAGRPREAARA